MRPRELRGAGTHDHRELPLVRAAQGRPDRLEVLRRPATQARWRAGGGRTRCVFLASGAADFINGTTIEIDGGMLPGVLYEAGLGRSPTCSDRIERTRRGPSDRPVLHRQRRVHALRTIIERPDLELVGLHARGTQDRTRRRRLVRYRPTDRRHRHRRCRRAGRLRRGLRRLHLAGRDPSARGACRDQPVPAGRHERRWHVVRLVGRT